MGGRRWGCQQGSLPTLPSRVPLCWQNHRSKSTAFPRVQSGSLFWGTENHHLHRSPDQVTAPAAPTPAGGNPLLNFLSFIY